MAGVSLMVTPRRCLLVRCTSLVRCTIAVRCTREQNIFRNGRGSPAIIGYSHSRAAGGTGMDASGQRGDRAERVPAVARPKPGKRSAPPRTDPGGRTGPDLESWPFDRPRYVFPPAGRAVRDEKHEQRIAEHVQRHKGRGARPPRDRGLSRDEIVRTAIAVA